MDRRQFLAAGSLGIAGGAFTLANATPTAGATAATPSTVRSGTDDFHFGFTGYDVAVTIETEVESGAPVSFDVTTTGDAVGDGESVAFEVSMTNESSESVAYYTGAPEPFGVLGLRDERTSTTITPWTDAYESSGYVSTSESRGVGPVASIATEVELDPGETIGERYVLSTETHRVRPGSYEGRVAAAVSHDPEADESWRVAADLTVDVEPAAEPDPPRYERSLTADPIDDPDFDGRIDVEVLEPLTDTHPGLIEVTFSSEWEETRSLDVFRELPFGTYVSEPVAGARLVLQTDDMYAPGFARREGCWRSPFVPDHFHGRFTTAVDPGERHRLRYVVLGHPSDDCPPAGDYEFTARYETGGEDSVTKEKQAAELGVTLSLGEAADGYEAAMRPSGSGQAASPTPSPTATPGQTPTSASTVTRTESPATATSDGPTGSRSTEGAATTDPGGPREPQGTDSPVTEDLSGFGAGAAVTGIAGWLGIRRLREDR